MADVTAFKGLLLREDERVDCLVLATRLAAVG